MTTANATPNLPPFRLSPDTAPPELWTASRMVLTWGAMMGTDEAVMLELHSRVGALALIAFYSFGRRPRCKHRTQRRHVRLEGKDYTVTESCRCGARRTRTHPHTGGISVTPWSKIVLLLGALVLLGAPLTACSVEQLDGRELEPTGELEQPEPPALEQLEPSALPSAELAPTAELEPLSALPSAELAPTAELEPLIFTLPAARCAGHWADNSDPATRFVAHPDTGLCTFACVHEGCSTTGAQWDSRCYPDHAAVLGELCANLGGTCARNADHTNRYCVAP